MHNIATLYQQVDEIATRIESLNPTKPGCMDQVKEFLTVHEIGCAVDTIFQGICNEYDPFLIDISLHDLVFLIEIAPEVGSFRAHLKLGDIDVMSEYIMKKFSG